LEIGSRDLGRAHVGVSLYWLRRRYSS